MGDTDGFWAGRSQESPESPAPPLSTLRIKSENGEQAFLMMMRPEDTIGDVRSLLAQARWALSGAGGCRGRSGPTTRPDPFCLVSRAVDANIFEIFSPFPPTVYHEDALTLQAAGLVPNAALLMRACQAQPPEP